MREDVNEALDLAAHFYDEIKDSVNRDWMVDAACRVLGVTDPEYADQMFFPVGQRDPLRAERHRLCDSCPVQKTCDIYGTYAGKQDGAWGGLTSDERRTRRAIQRAKDVSKYTG